MENLPKSTIVILTMLKTRVFGNPLVLWKALLPTLSADQLIFYKPKKSTDLKFGNDFPLTQRNIVSIP